MPSRRAAVPFLAADYLMIHTLNVEHFRCYQNLKVAGLKRVNVIVGGNGTGKTALLESIFLAGGGSPEIALRLQNFRGMGTAQEISGDGLRSLWKDLFFGFDQNVPVRIDLIDNSARPRSLSVSLTEDDEVSLPIEEYESGSGIVRNIPIEFVWTDSSGTFRSRPVINENGRIAFPSARNTNVTAFFPAQFRLNPEETAKRLSDLNKEDELGGMVELIHEVYPEVASTSVEHNAGSWQTFVKLEGMKSRIPIGLHSAGATKFVALVLGIASMVGGCVLIDEIENGFYYDRLPAIWDALYAVAVESRCQLFITTHSMECLRALQPALEKHGKHFALLKTERRGPDAKVFVSSGESMTAAIESGFEIR